ncbi:MAG: PDZ domain-containing protein, partial [Candidatus Cybelea sp.]
GFNYAQCVSFRNVATKVVTAVDFAFVVTNPSGGVEANYGWTDKGTFTPPVNIENHCFGGQLWAPRVVRAMANESVRVTQVSFADGTSWQPKTQFLRGYAATGAPLAQPIVENPSGGASNDESVAAPHPASLLGLSLEDRASGVYVKFVAPGSAAAAADLRQGDRIVAIGSNKVSSVTDVRTILEMTPNGTAIPISVERDGQTLNVGIKVTATPPSAGP